MLCHDHPTDNPHTCFFACGLAEQELLMNVLNCPRAPGKTSEASRISKKKGGGDGAACKLVSYI